MSAAKQILCAVGDKRPAVATIGARHYCQCCGEILVGAEELARLSLRPLVLPPREPPSAARRHIAERSRGRAALRILVKK